MELQKKINHFLTLFNELVHIKLFITLHHNLLTVLFFLSDALLSQFWMDVSVSLLDAAILAASTEPEIIFNLILS